ncbi:MAG: hypothetical protein F6K28_21745 [Microcoleus sp. SIO2G3]|nr:hypothetical protein [Microcoleus sp. SIO2G3]
MMHESWWVAVWLCFKEMWYRAILKVRSTKAIAIHAAGSIDWMIVFSSKE